MIGTLIGLLLIRMTSCSRSSVLILHDSTINALAKIIANLTTKDEYIKMAGNKLNPDNKDKKNHR